MTLEYIFNKKFSRRLSNRSGVTADRYGYSLDTKVWDDDIKGWEYMLNNEKNVFSGPNLYRAYSQFVYKFTDNFEIKPGLSFVWFALNDDVSVEPRLGVNWKTGTRTSLNFGYGKHSRLQSMATYFLETMSGDGQVLMTNHDLGFTKAHHWVLGFDALLSEQLRFKAETYYQYLYDVPVEREPSFYSMLNTGAEWGLNTRDFLVNEGKGWNYGDRIHARKILQQKLLLPGHRFTFRFEIHRQRRHKTEYRF